MKTNKEIEEQIKTALKKVSAETGHPEDWFCEFHPQIPDEFTCGKDIAIYGRSPNGDLAGKTLADLIEIDASQFIKFTAMLGEALLGGAWINETIYENVAKISWSDEGNPSREMFLAQYDEISECFSIIQEEYRPYITFLVTGNTACPSEEDRIGWNEPAWDYIHSKGFDKKRDTLEVLPWRKDGEHEFTISLFRCDGRYFLELDRPEHGHNEEHVMAIIEVLKRNKVI